MSKSKPLLFITPHHVGTWFLFNFLLKHPQVGSFCCHNHFEWLNNNKDIPYSKIARVVNFERRAEMISTDSEYVLYHAHPPYQYSEYLHMMMNFVPTFVAVRDPLLSLISYVKRYQHDTKRYPNGKDDEVNDINLWKTFIRTVQGSNGIYIVPMDLISEDNDSVQLVTLSSLLDHLGLEPNAELVSRTVKDWTPVNILEYPEKQFYYSKQIANIREFINPLWDQLKACEDEFRPFLELCGYRNLLWWT